MRQVVAFGYYGSGNLGDDTMLASLASALAPHEVEVVAASGNPEATQRDLGLFAVQRRDLRAVRHALIASDALVFGGGSIFQDTTSLRSCLFYWAASRLAKRTGKPLVFLGQGVGPLRRPLARRIARSAFLAASVIAVRDAESGDLLRSIGVNRPIHLTADLALLAEVPPTGARAGVGIAARPHGQNITGLVGALSTVLPDSRRIAFDLVHDAAFLRPADLRPLTPAALIAEIASLEAMVAMRLHAGILATHCGVPAVMLSYDPKVAAFARRAGAICLDRESDWTVGQIETALAEARTAGVRLDLVESLRADARRNIDLLLACLPSTRLAS